MRTIGVTGASGFIGRALRKECGRRGLAASALGRVPGPQSVEPCDAIVHLAGESVAGRWTRAKKAEIEHSRVRGTRALVDAIAAASCKPRVLVSASAVGYYGDRGEESLEEPSAPGNDFLAGVCVAWEREALRAEQFGVRVVTMRTGIVFGAGGGALPKMVLPFRFFAGGPIGRGRQYVPWIHLDDIVALYLRAIDDETFRGPVNAVAPDYATNARLAKAIGAAMHRPSFLPAPAFALRVALGEFSETLLGGQRVVPAAAQARGFIWRHPLLEPALQAILGGA